MTTELEKQFFNTFGIEPMEQEVFVLKRMVVKEYPQITDRILLQLLVIINDFYFRVDSIEELKEVVLKECIKWADEYRHQVQALFKE